MPSGVIAAAVAEATPSQQQEETTTATADRQQARQQRRCCSLRGGRLVAALGCLFCLVRIADLHLQVAASQSQRLSKELEFATTVMFTNNTDNAAGNAANAAVADANTTVTCLAPGNETVTLPRLFPNFIIIGAQKGGTTALSELLSHVPHLLKPLKKEAHFWDFVKIPDAAFPEERCRAKRRYYRLWDTSPRTMAKVRQATEEAAILYEKTPKLLAMSGVPDKITDLMSPHRPKIVVVLRDPIERAYSSHKMAWQFSGKKRKEGTFPTFDDMVEMGVRRLIGMGKIRAPPFYAADHHGVVNGTEEEKEANGRTRRWNPVKKYNYPLERGFYADQLRHWAPRFPLGESLLVLRYEDLCERKRETLGAVLAFVAGPVAAVAARDIPAKALDRKYSPNRGGYYYPPIRNETRAYLKLLYKPFNDDLADLLGESWRGVWD